MEQPDPFGFVGLTYDDVMLLPGHTDVIPSDADTNPGIFAPHLVGDGHCY